MRRAGTNFTYDGRGNLTSTGTATYGYDVYNRLTSAGSATLSYDPGGRLYQTTSNGTTVTGRLQYDGVDLIAEYNSSNAMLRRYVHGPGIDEPIVWYEGSGTSDRRWLHQDQLGSVVAASDSSGALIGSPNTYDEYGVPGSSNTGRFQYTGQTWVSEASLYYYKARAYVPVLGRFAQSDPVLYAGGINVYAYVEADPINDVDPSGLDNRKPKDEDENCHGCIVVVGIRPLPWQQTGAGAYASLIMERGARLGAILASLAKSPNTPQCPTDPAVTEFLNTVAMPIAAQLNADAMLTGQVVEAGGALGSTPYGLAVSDVSFAPNAMTLSASRGALANRGITPLYDWHTHVDEGVSGRGYGFSLGVNGGDIMSTALTSPSFIGSFVVMSDRILFMPREMARDLAGGTRVSNEGVRC